MMRYCGQFDPRDEMCKAGTLYLLLFTFNQFRGEGKERGKMEPWRGGIIRVRIYNSINV